MATPTIPPVPGTAPQSSSKATTAVVVGVIGLICCNFLGPVAWYLANQELQAIAQGLSADSNRGMAQVAKILGIIGTVFLVLGVLWLVAFGGMAVVTGLSGASGM